LRFGLQTIVLVIGLVLVGCSGRGVDSSTRLTILAVNPSVGRAAFHLDCAPAGGDLEDVSRACAALATQPQLVTSPTPFVCYGGSFSWWDITITGRLHGRPVRTHTATCWTSQMAMIRELGIGQESLRAHLLDRRRETVVPGLSRTFPVGGLLPGDLVTCDILGHSLEDGVPIEFVTSSTGFGGRDVTSVVLSVTRNRDGSVTASCHRGST
jgi:hypothetical protein